MAKFERSFGGNNQMIQSSCIHVSWKSCIRLQLLIGSLIKAMALSKEVVGSLRCLSL